MLELAADLGAEVERLSAGELRIHAADDPRTELDEELCGRIRASVLFTGPLLARCGRAVVPPPGGDVIGRRRLDTHMNAFERLGARVNAGRRVDVSADRLQRRERVPRRSLGNGHRERRHGRRARPGRDRHRERGQRAARPGSLPLSGRAGSGYRRHRLQRPAGARRRASAGRRLAHLSRSHRGRELHRARRGHRGRDRHRGRRAGAPGRDLARVRAARRVVRHRGHDCAGSRRSGSWSFATTSARRSRRSRTAPGRPSPPTSRRSRSRWPRRREARCSSSRRCSRTASSSWTSS